jgi:hypothetical protein
MSYDVFIAYPNPDQALARELAVALRARGRRPFFDQEALPGGEPWGPSIVAALESTEVVVVLVSENSAAAHYQRDEVARALDRELRQRPGRRVVPVTLKAEVPMPYGLKPLQAIPWTEAEGVADQICAVLPAGAPSRSALVGPPVMRDDGLAGRGALTRDLAVKVQGGQSVQLLGEHRMGKTSMLRWLRRHPPAGRPPVWIDAGLATLGPWELVEAVATAFDERLRSELADLRRRGVPSAAGVQRLPPALVLVDEAQRLARPGHHFTRDDLEAWRTRTQKGEIVWVSTSLQSITVEFQQTGLTSNFLNDSVQLRVGGLEAGGVEALVRAEAVGACREAFGDLAYPAQLVNDALGSEVLEGAVALAAGRLRDEVFPGWWQRRSPAQQATLRRIASGQTPMARERPSAFELKALGLVCQEEGEFRVAGSTWRDFLRELT